MPALSLESACLLGINRLISRISLTFLCMQRPVKTEGVRYSQGATRRSRLSIDQAGQGTAQDTLNGMEESVSGIAHQLRLFNESEPRYIHSNNRLRSSARRSRATSSGCGVSLETRASRSRIILQSFITKGTIVNIPGGANNDNNARYTPSCTSNHAHSNRELKAISEHTIDCQTRLPA
jgi:hypothetical protein